MQNGLIFTLTSIRSFGRDKYVDLSSIQSSFYIDLASCYLLLLHQKTQYLYILRSHVLVNRCLLSYHILKNLERSLHRGSIDFLFLMFVLSLSLEIIASFFSINHLGNIFKYSIYYLYGRNN